MLGSVRQGCLKKANYPFLKGFLKLKTQPADCSTSVLERVEKKWQDIFTGLKNKFCLKEMRVVVRRLSRGVAMQQLLFLHGLFSHTS